MEVRTRLDYLTIAVSEHLIACDAVRETHILCCVDKRVVDDLTDAETQAGTPR